MFEFLRRDLGHLPQGSVVEVAIDKQANVVLLDDLNFHAYQGGGRWSGCGGWYVSLRSESPCPTQGVGMSPSILAAVAGRSGHPSTF